MEVTLKSAEGLDRRFAVKVTAAELNKRLEQRLTGMAPRMQIKGFRKGKAPLSFLKKMYGRGVMDEIVRDIVNESATKTFADAKLQVAGQPRAELVTDYNAVIEGKADLIYDVHGEILPTIEPMDVAAITLVRPVADVDDEDVDAQLKTLVERNRSYEARKASAKAQNGDQLLIDYAGAIDGKTFEGGTGTDQEVVLGEGRLIAGFEEQLVGAKADAEVLVNVTFPADYGKEDLAGKAAVFAVKVKEVRAPKDPEVDDDFAKKLGLADLAELKSRLRDRAENENRQLTRAHMKRALLDRLDEGHSFPLPPMMVEQEFQQIWRQVEQAERDEEDKGKTDEELKVEYRKIAERRVRLGLVLAEIGKRADVAVPADDLRRAVQERAMMDARILQMQGQQVTPQDVLKMYQQNPGAIAEIRAPLFEERVVDYIFERAKVTEKKVAKDELRKDPDGDLAA
ncbi:MAG: trigger factor [Parvularculaceae bacterium]|nr:trigger factor [Parvularculaceae bacterium]